MNKKTITLWSVGMIVVFLIIIVAYPLIFKPGPDSLAPPDSVPISQPVMPGP